MPPGRWQHRARGRGREDDFVGEDFPVFNDEAEFLRGESSGEEVVLPVGELVALVEFDAADSDGGGPVVAWGLEFGGLGAIGQGGAVIVHAVKLTMGQPLRPRWMWLISSPPRGRARSPRCRRWRDGRRVPGGCGYRGSRWRGRHGVAGRRGCRGDASVVVDAVDFTVGERGILGFVLGAAVADAEVEVAVLKDEACAEVDSAERCWAKGASKRVW